MAFAWERACKRARLGGQPCEGNIDLNLIAGKEHFHGRVASARGSDVDTVSAEKLRIQRWLTLRGESVLGQRSLVAQDLVSCRQRRSGRRSDGSSGRSNALNVY